MVKAWRLAVVEVGMGARPNAKVKGGAGAMMAACRRLAWAAPSPDAYKTQDDVVLYFGDGQAQEGTHAADPRSVRRWLEDAYECEIMRHSEVAKDINCIGGARGYGREKEGGRAADGTLQYYGENEAEDKAARIWRGGRFEQKEGLVVVALTGRAQDGEEKRKDIGCRLITGVRGRGMVGSSEFTLAQAGAARPLQVRKGR